MLISSMLKPDKESGDENGAVPTNPPQLSSVTDAQRDELATAVAAQKSARASCRALDVARGSLCTTVAALPWPATTVPMGRSDINARIAFAPRARSPARHWPACVSKEKLAAYLSLHYAPRDRRGVRYRHLHRIQVAPPLSPSALEEISIQSRQLTEAIKRKELFNNSEE